MSMIQGFPGVTGFPVQFQGAATGGSISQLFGQGAAPGQVGMSPGSFQQLLQGVMQVLAQLGGGWSGIAGGQQQQVDPQVLANQQAQLKYYQQGIQDATAGANYWKQQAMQQLGLAGQIGVPFPGAGQFNPAAFLSGMNQDPYAGSAFADPSGGLSPFGGSGFGGGTSIFQLPQQQQLPFGFGQQQGGQFRYNPGQYQGSPYQYGGGGGTAGGDGHCHNPDGTTIGTGYGGGGTTTGTGYGGGTVSTNPNDPNAPYNQGLAMRLPGDPNEYSSYLAMQLAGGALSGNTSVRQSDALQGTRMATVQDPTQWHASVARAYAVQFAAQAGEDSGSAPAGTYNPLSAQGLANGENYFKSLSPDARVFAQVASVFKGNLMNGPGVYDNAKLKTLLASKGLTQLANGQNVGQTDVQTIGAITTAINEGKLSLSEVIGSGAIAPADMPRYNQIISYVTNGSFNQDLARFDANPASGTNGNQLPFERF